MAAWLGTVAQIVGTGYQIYNSATQPSAGDVGRGAATGPTVGSPGIVTSSQMGGSTVPAAAMMPILGNAMRSIGPRIATSLGLISRSAAGKRLIRLAKWVGLNAAASALGISIADALGLLGEQLGRRRRARGISARDIRVTRRTTRRLIRAAQDVSTLGSCLKVKRRSTCP